MAGCAWLVSRGFFPEGAAALIFYKHFIGDFQRDTSHLSLTERGAYRSLLDHHYATEKPLPKDVDALCRIVGAVSKADRQAVAAVIPQFWTETADGWINARAQVEMGKAQHQRTVNQAIGLKGGNPYLKEQYNEPGELYAARLADGRIKIGITASGWSKRAYGLSKTYGSRPELLCLVRVQDMGLCEAQILSKFSSFATGETLSIPDESLANLFSEMQAKGEPIHQPNRVGIRPPITSPSHSQTPDINPKRPDPPAAAPVPDPKKALFDLGVSVLGERRRSLIGKAVATVGLPKVGEVLAYMAGHTVADPVSYFTKATQPEERKLVV